MRAPRALSLMGAVGALAALGACGGDDHGRPRPTATLAQSGPLASCARPSPIGDAPGGGGPEVRGRGAGAQLHGLIMARRLPLVAGPDEVKIVWRMTGSGALELAQYDGAGHRATLSWGPEPHGDGSYRRPGAEWGAGYRFRRPGCYRLTARRAGARAEVWLRVGASSA